MRISQIQILTKVLDSADYSLILDNGLDVTFFPTYKTEYTYIKEHYDKYGVVPDKATFFSAFPKFQDIGEVSEANSYLIESIYKEKQLREIISSMKSLESIIKDGNVDDAISAVSNLSVTIKNSTYLNAINMFEDKSRYDEYADKIDNYMKHYTSTGFPELDEAIGGWDRNEEIATIVARPGVGKSWFLVKSILGALNSGLNVGLYSGEMSAHKVGYRFDTLVSNISNSAMMRGRSEIQNEYQSYLSSLNERFKGKFWVITPLQLNGDPAKVSDLEAFVNKYDLDILFIDQHSLLDDQRNGKTPIEKAYNISRDLKSMQTRVRIPIISASQQNRSGDDNRRDKDGNKMEVDFDVSRIAQADRIGQDSTVVIFLERNKDNDTFTMHLAKARDGSSTNTKFNYTVQLDKGVFIYNPIDENNPSDADRCQELKDRFEPEGMDVTF